MTFCDMLAHVSMRRCFKSLVTAAGVADRCLYNVHVPASVHKFCSQPDYLADTDLGDKVRSPVFPAKGAGLFHEHRVTSECIISVAAT